MQAAGGSKGGEKPVTDAAVQAEGETIGTKQASGERIIFTLSDLHG